MALDTVQQQFQYSPILSAIPSDDLVTMVVNLVASTTYPKGSAVGEVTATPGTFGLYASGASDGTQNPTAICQFSYATDASGNVTVGQNASPSGLTKKAVPVIFFGFVRTQDVPSLDATLAAKLGKIVRGTTTAGILLIR